MKVGDIYIEALKLMFATGMEDITADPEAGGITLAMARMDAQYADLLLAMPGSLARCLRDMEVRRVCVAAEGFEAPDAPSEGEDGEAVPPRRTRRTLPTVTALTDDTEELEVPEVCAVLAPWYIAADLYRREEPALASECRERYEAGVAQILASADLEAIPQGTFLEFGEGFMD